jgi:hypothetical protein
MEAAMTSSSKLATVTSIMAGFCVGWDQDLQQAEG